MFVSLSQTTPERIFQGGVVSFVLFVSDIYRYSHNTLGTHDPTNAGNVWPYTVIQNFMSIVASNATSPANTNTRLPLLTLSPSSEISSVMRLGFVAIVLDPPHGPGSNGFSLEVETDGKQGEEGHDAGVHAISFHVAELGGGRYKTGGAEEGISLRIFEKQIVYSRIGQTETYNSPCGADQRQHSSASGRVAVEQVGLTGDTCGD